MTMNNISLEKEICDMTKQGTVTEIDLKNGLITIRAEENRYFVQAKDVFNLAGSIDAVKPGQEVELSLTHIGRLIMAKFIYPEVKRPFMDYTCGYPL